MLFRLEEVAEFQKGFAFKSKDFKESGIKIVKVSNLTDESIDALGCVHIGKELADSYKQYELNKDDIIITTVGSWPTNPASVVGKVVRVPKKMNQSLLNQNAVRVRSNKIVDQRYLYYLLKSNIFSDYIVGTAQGSANQASITQKDIKNFKFNIHELNEQKLIANILSSLDEKIETNNQINKKLEEMAQAIFKQWFVDFEFPNEEGEPYKSSGGEMIESEMGMIPKGWEVSKLEEIIYFNPKEGLKKDNEYKFVEMAAIDNNTSNIKYWELRKLNGGSKFRNGDTLLARITPCLENGKTAYVSILEEKEVAVGSTEFIVMRGKEENKKVYIYCLAREENFRAHAIKSMSGSSGRQRVQLDLLKGYKIVQAPNAIYDKFDRIGESLFEEISSRNKEITRLAKLRDLLLPKLMSGEIGVPVEVSES